MKNVFPYKKNVAAFSLLMMLIIAGINCKRESLYLKRLKPEVILRASDARLQSDVIHLSGDSVYILASDLTRNTGQSLLIDAGTLIKANDKTAVIINPGATIEANGTASDPIVFTSSANKGGVGAVTGATNTSDKFWYGIRIYGDALSVPSASSGSISYMRVEFAGGNDNFLGLPSLLFQNVSKETKLENIQVSYSYSTPSFEFYGGNCTASNLVSYASGGADFFIHEGYQGMLQFLLAYRHPYFPASTGVFNSPLAGFLLDGDSTFPVISNLSVIGPSLQNGTAIQYTSTFGPRASLITDNNTRFLIRNSVLLGFPLGAFYMNSQASAVSLQSGESEFTYSSVQSDDSNRVFYLPPNLFPPFTSADFKSFMLEPQFGNQHLPGINEFMLQDPFNYDIQPDPFPKPGSPILSGANFDGIFDDPFFRKVSYRGALGADNWLQGWTNFKPLQTNYNY